MTDFRTDVRVTYSVYPITLKTPVLTAGSCFADAIGHRLDINKFKVLTNPFGVIYNPHSIHKAIRYAIQNEPAADHLFIQNNDVHLNYDFHSELSSLSKTDLMQRLTNTIGSVHYFLKDTSWILITYGTAWVYNRVDTGEIVANCHKMPASNFRKTLMTEDSIVKSFEQLFSDLKKYNPNVRVILTVSPVRHIKDTLELNSASKSALRIACHSIAQKFEGVEYFPAYEMMLDDLRDYRFYKSDLIHPTEVAEDYIWNKFAERYFDDSTKQFINDWTPLRSALNHKPFHPQSKQHQQFLHDTIRKLERLKTTVNVEHELDALKKQIAS
jgi:hypothetical protein